MSDGWVNIPPRLAFPLDRISGWADCKEVGSINEPRGPFIDLLKPRNISPKRKESDRFDLPD